MIKIIRAAWPWISDAIGVVCIFAMLWLGMIYGFAVQ